MSTPVHGTPQCPQCDAPLTLTVDDVPYGPPASAGTQCPACGTESTWAVEMCHTYYLGDLLEVDGQPAASVEVSHATATR